MGLPIYKPGQGYWTRVLSAVGAGTLVLAGAAWLMSDKSPLPRLGFVTNANELPIKGSAAAAVVIGFGLLIYFLLNKPKVVDFMIAVEAEMKKVNWPSKKEIIGSTWVVICGTFLFAGLLFVINILFGFIFTQIGILAPTTS